MQDAFRARVLFPIFSDTGEAVALGGRVLPGSSDPAKYKNSPETPIYAKSRTLYGLNWAKAEISTSPAGRGSATFRGPGTGASPIALYASGRRRARANAAPTSRLTSIRSWNSVRVKPGQQRHHA